MNKGPFLRIADAFEGPTPIELVTYSEWRILGKVVGNLRSIAISIIRVKGGVVNGI